MKIIKKVMFYIFFTIFITSMVMIENDSNIPLVACGVSFILMLLCAEKKSKARKYYY